MSKEYNLAVMPGDFIGKEVVAEEMRVLRAVADKYGSSFKIIKYPNGGENYLKTGELITDSTLRELRDYDAIVFGAVGHPDVDPSILEKGILLKIRIDLDQYVILRPSKLYRGVDAKIRKIHPDLPDGFVLYVVREGAGGLYKGDGALKIENGHLVAYEKMEYSDWEIDRVNRHAFELARKEGKEGKPLNVLLSLKSNILEFVCGKLWQPRFNSMAAREYPDINTDYMHIDALMGPGLISTSPKDLGVIVTTNMFGDVLTDLTAALFGGMGVGASANINPNGTSMFEPVHGSSPKDYGKGVVSPIAAILSGAMMLENIGEEEAARGLELAVENVLAAGKIPTLTICSGVPTQQQTEYIIEDLKKN